MSCCNRITSRKRKPKRTCILCEYNDGWGCNYNPTVKFSLKFIKNNSKFVCPLTIAP